MNPNDLEHRLSSLSLTQASDNYAHTGQQLLRHQVTTPRNVWPMRLNYALAASLLLSLGFNLFQLLQAPSAQTTLSQQCEVNTGLPDNALLLPEHTAYPALQETRDRLPSGTPHLC